MEAPLFTDFCRRRKANSGGLPPPNGVVDARRGEDYRHTRFAASDREAAMFKGSFVALITPFRDGKVDETAFQEHVAWQLGQGTHGLVPIGTTGECPALDDHE